MVSESQKAHQSAEAERALAEDKLRKMQALVSLAARPFEPANPEQVEGTDFQKSSVKGHRSTDMEPERARYQKDLRDFEYTISQTRAKYQSKSSKYHVFLR
jgi:hypothetical protein